MRIRGSDIVFEASDFKISDIEMLFLPLMAEIQDGQRQLDDACVVYLGRRIVLPPLSIYGVPVVFDE